MTRVEYQEALEELRADVLSMGELVGEQLQDGLTAMEQQDTELGTAVIEKDAAVNERYLEIEGDCINLFALQQPVASDLRFIAASFKIVTDLERIGDLATNFGQYTVGGDRTVQIESTLFDIGDDVRGMVEAALKAYDDEDASACHRIAARDDEIDAQCHVASERLVRELIEDEFEVDGWEIERLLDEVSRVLLTLRDLERVGDHAVNIASRSLYMVESNPELIY